MIVSGNENISTEEIEKIAEEKLKTSFSILGMDFATESIFLSFGNKLQELKSDLPEIDQVRIKKNFPSGISIEIIEKDPFAVWLDEEEYLVDKKGSFIKKTEEGVDYNNLISVRQIESFDDLDKKEVLNSFYIIKTKIGEEIIKISYFELFKDKIKVITEEGFPIIFDLRQDLEWQIEKLLVVLSKKSHLDNFNQIEYIDLRFDNQTVVKIIE